MVQKIQCIASSKQDALEGDGYIHPLNNLQASEIDKLFHIQKIFLIEMT